MSWIGEGFENKREVKCQSSVKLTEKISVIDKADNENVSIWEDCYQNAV